MKEVKTLNFVWYISIVDIQLHKVQHTAGTCSAECHAKQLLTCWKTRDKEDRPIYFSLPNEMTTRLEELIVTVSWHSGLGFGLGLAYIKPHHTHTTSQLRNGLSYPPLWDLHCAIRRIQYHINKWTWLMRIVRATLYTIAFECCVCPRLLHQTFVRNSNRSHNCLHFLTKLQAISTSYL